MNKTLSQLIKISNQTGKDTSLVQGGGGNTSAKTGDGKFMYVKASGTALKDMDSKNGWRKLELDKVLELLTDDSLMELPTDKREKQVVSRLQLACSDDFGDQSRPSVEAHLHSILDRYVIHLHPVKVGAFVNAKNGKSELEKLFKGEKCPPLWIPYVDPGLTLARKTRKYVNDYEKQYGCKPEILFLEKHGLFVSCSSSEQALKSVRKVIKKCESKLRKLKSRKSGTPAAEDIHQAKLAIRNAAFKVTGQYLPVVHFYNDDIAAFASHPNAKKMLSKPALTPDELIYANGAPMWLDNGKPESITKKLSRNFEKTGKIPSALILKPFGLFVVSKPAAAETVKDIALGSLYIRYNADKLGGIASLNKRQREFILNWEAESFRQKMVTGETERPLTGRIAVVTGAGSGLGKSIAVGLGRAGASVALADIDIDAAEKTADRMREENPKIGVLPVKCNVTDAESVQKGYEQVLDKWGGLDILVNAAGVAPAFPLVDMPVDKWRMALEINLTGYFLMAKYAARIMLSQGIGGSIVNISSKSGLDASKNNGAYNATKSGELHLARGWAKELGEYGIRVNSVCPGNVFEGSKIWNPKYIRECAKKYGIKPEEVIPYYINKTTLKREIKGQDVADSVVFLCSDKARTITAQTIVPDSGQVPVR